MEKSSQPLPIISREARRKSVTKTQEHPKKERKPKNPNLRNKAYKFRISPTQKQSGKLAWILRRCKELYNAALEERREAKKELSRLYRKARTKRRDFLHQQSHNLVKNYGTLVFEELHIDNMTKAPDPKQDEDGKYLPNGAAAKGGLNKSILDAGWGAFVTICSHKAAEAGGKVVKVAPHGTSQACSGCECVVPLFGLWTSRTSTVRSLLYPVEFHRLSPTGQRSGCPQGF